MDVKNYYISHLDAIKIINGGWYITSGQEIEKSNSLLDFL